MPEYKDVAPWEVGHAAWNRGWVRPWGLLRIAAWKSAQSLGWLSLAKESIIEERTAAAIDELKAWRHYSMVGVTDIQVWAEWRETSRTVIGSKSLGTGLLGITGVGYPMATAILCILDPTCWPVIDKWAVQTVFGTKDDGNAWSDVRWQSASAYEAYARHLATVGAQSWGLPLNLHGLDHKAMRASQGRKGELVGLPSGWSTAWLPAADK